MIPTIEWLQKKWKQYNDEIFFGRLHEIKLVVEQPTN